MFFAYLGTGSDQQPRRAHVLLVEDEEMVRAMIIRALEREGYRVSGVGNASEAIEVFDRARPPVDILLSDVRLPGPSGPEIYRTLASRRPDLPVVFMSGYGEKALEMIGESMPGYLLLGKPFTPSALRKAVEIALHPERRKARGNGNGTSI